ncbi:MAG: hypothetical protein Q7S53_00630 [bacterium]|nr:hypothetical protein [bacterium]
MKRLAKTLFLVSLGTGLGGVAGFVGGTLFANRKWTEMMFGHMKWLERMVEISGK